MMYFIKFYFIFSIVNSIIALVVKTHLIVLYVLFVYRNVTVLFV